MLVLEEDVTDDDKGRDIASLYPFELLPSAVLELEGMVHVPPLDIEAPPPLLCNAADADADADADEDDDIDTHTTPIAAPDFLFVL